MRTIRKLLLAASAVAGSVSGAGIDAPSARAQGWSPFPDRDPPNWSAAPARPAPDQSRRPQDPSAPAPAQTAQQGWSPAPREDQRSAPYAAPSPSGSAADEGDNSQGPPSLPEPGRGRPPGYLGELPSGNAGPGRDPNDRYGNTGSPGSGGSIIPDRQLPPPGRTQTSPQQATPREPIPGGYRPYYGQRQAPTPAPGPVAEPQQPEGRPRMATPALRPSVQDGMGEAARGVESRELPPVMSADGTGLPLELWRGLTVPEVEQLMAGVAIPPRSSALHALWRRLLLAKGSEPTGGKTATHFLALRLAALFRSGLLQDLATETRSAASAEAGAIAAQDAATAPSDIVVAVLRAKAQLGLGEREQACVSARGAKYQGEVPRPVAQDALLLIAYCSAVEGNPAAASLTADMIREQQMEAPLAFAVIDLLASGPAREQAGGNPKLAIPKDVSLLDYRFLQLANAQDGLHLLERAEPALIAALAREARDDAKLQVEAAEDAARIHALDAAGLMSVYRSVTLPNVGDPLTAKLDPPLKRAALAQTIPSERVPSRQARLIQALMHEARSHVLYLPVAQALAPELKNLRQSPELAFFAETAVEIALAGADYATAVSWAIFGSAGESSSHSGPGRGDGLMHWTTLIDVAGAKPYVPRGSGLKLTEEMALRGKLPPQLLHRLVTVLDALEYDIPIPLWDAASRTPQPTSGHLPETGVLARLKQAATERKFALTVLLAMQALGADGAEGAHVLALGDAIRALKAAGLEEDARRLGFEALFAAWPRGAGG